MSGAKQFWLAAYARVAIGACSISLTLGCGAAFSETPQERAWGILQSGLGEHKTAKRAAAVACLRFLQGDARAIGSAEKALADKKPAVRVAAAIALGQIGTRYSMPPLKIAMTDKENGVAFAAADAVISLGDSAGYDLYYRALTGERKNSEDWFSDKRRLIVDPGAMVILGFGYGLRYVPFYGYGWTLWQEFTKDYVTPVRVEALKRLANDRDLRVSEVLLRNASDKHPAVRMAALAAIARHGDPGLLPAAVARLTDKKAEVRYVAAAAILRLSSFDSMQKPACEMRCSPE